MTRNRNIDVFRAAALLLVMLYHCWVLTGSKMLVSPVVTNFIALGGEIGVTAFFVLSGFGIFLAIDKTTEKGNFIYFSFLKRRFYRIAPQYYLCLLVVVLISDAQYFSGYGIKMIISHLFFVHNLFPDCSSTINGALWTMGVTVQFYIIAPLLYKIFKKWSHLALLSSILFTIAMKTFLFSILLPYLGKSGHLEFFIGRQLFSALDNFCIGMYAAVLIKEKKFKIERMQAWIISILFTILLFIISNLGIRYGVNTNNWSGYIWHSCCAVILGGIMFGISYLKAYDKVWLYKKFIQLSHYEYGIYVWHLLIIRNLIDRSAWVQTGINKGYAQWLYIPLLTAAILTGVVFTRLSDRKAAVP